MPIFVSIGGTMCPFRPPNFCTNLNRKSEISHPSWKRHAHRTMICIFCAFFYYLHICSTVRLDLKSLRNWSRKIEVLGCSLMTYFLKSYNPINQRVPGIFTYVISSMLNVIYTGKGGILSLYSIFSTKFEQYFKLFLLQ